jgi:hypothetical protein
VEVQGNPRDINGVEILAENLQLLLSTTAQLRLGAQALIADTAPPSGVPRLAQSKAAAL